MSALTAFFGADGIGEGMEKVREEGAMCEGNA